MIDGYVAALLYPSYVVLCDDLIYVGRVKRSVPVRFLAFTTIIADEIRSYSNRCTCRSAF